MTVLNEKRVPYEIEYIDLSNKPDWFLEISPTGKVPVVQTPDGHVLFESAVINEYLDEMHPPHLLRGTPLERAQDRMWLDFVTGMYGPVYNAFSDVSQEQYKDAIHTIATRLTKLEPVIAGPYFSGETFGLVDASVAPVFTRLSWIGRLAGEPDPFDGLPIVKAWSVAILTRSSVQESVLPDIFDIFKNSITRNESWLSTQIN